MLTRAEIESRLEKGLLMKMVKFKDVEGWSHVDMLQRLAVNFKNGEYLVTIMLGSTLRRHECSLEYFNENLEILYGDTYTGDRTNISRLLEGDK